MQAYTASIKTWNDSTSASTTDGSSTYIPGLIHTEVELLHETSNWSSYSTVNLSIKHTNGVFNTLAYPTTFRNGSATYKLLSEGTASTTSATHPTLNIYCDIVPNYFANIKTLGQRIKELVQQRIASPIYTHVKSLGFTKDLREIRARETLHRVLGDDRYKSFLRKGFISVIAKSGLIYQIFPGLNFTKVYNRGIMVDRYCVILQGGFPPTDSLIMRYLMILNNEEQFKSLAVKHGAVHPCEVEVQDDNRSLLEIFKEYKKAA